LRNGRTNTKTVIGMHTFHFVFLNCLLHLLDCNFWTGIRLRYNWYLSYENVVQVNLARTWCWWWTPCRTQSLTEAGYTRRVFVFFNLNAAHRDIKWCSMAASGFQEYDTTDYQGNLVKTQKKHHLNVFFYWLDNYPHRHCRLTMSHIFECEEMRSATIQIKGFALCF